MNTINDGGPMFPIPDRESANGDWISGHSGASLRDWLAGQETLREFDNPENVPNLRLCEALAGPRPDHGWSAKTPDEWVAMLQWEATWRARIKYIRADAMLKARAK